MTSNDRELMNRYIYQVVRRLPRAQRDEVGLELQELISDMMEEPGGTGQPCTMENVLSQLGDPAEFAKKYQDTNSCLIGPEYYENYLWIMKIVIICTMAGIAGGAVIEIIREVVFASESAWTAVIHGVIDIISNGMISFVSVFGGVTLVFAVMERQKVKVELKKQKEWSVNDLGDNFSTGRKNWTPGTLAPIPHKKAVISRGDSIVSIIFIVIFGILLIFAPKVFAAVFPKDGSVITIPVFNLEQWHIILPVFILSLFVGLADEILRLAAGCYCRVVMISSIVCGVLQIIFSFIVLKIFPFWNPDFGTQIQVQLGEQMNDIVGFVVNLDAQMASNGILVVLCLITIAEVGTTVYKTLRYGVD